MDTYRHFFDIDPDYFPAVNPDIIRKNPELWKKFFPHETFVKLVKDVVNVLTRKQKLNLWVEGAYGTGKSHAVLTLKHLLDADEADTRAYFEDFKLDNDLCNKFINAKSQGRIITVHRYASSNIHGDNDLFLAVQESIEKALKEAGIENVNTDSLKTGIIKYLSNEENKRSFEVYVKGSYAEMFGGDDVDTIIQHLSTYHDDALQELMAKISRVANEKQIKAFILDGEGIKAWIREIIHTNNLGAIVFIWDEFTEYFNNNMHQLTGFQDSIIEISETEPFCFIAVTHKSEGLFAETDSRKNKILGRFVRPTCEIKLPDNMAFQLMGKALDKKKDPVLLDEWNNILLDLCERTHDSRKQVKDAAKLTDADLEEILPIHPYAALLLKYISTSFESNQRSMFDFIKNDRGDEIKGFQWFIDNVGPLSDNPLLTIDQLWGYFYDMGKDNLSQNIRMVLDYYPRLVKTKPLTDTEKTILKTVLLLQAMSMKMDDSFEPFYATEKNLNNSFEGSDLENGEAVRCAEKLVRDNILYKKKLKGDMFVYAVLTGEMDSNKIDEHKKQYESKTTSFLIQEGMLNDCIELPAPLRLRYKMEYAGSTDFEQKAKKQISLAEEDDRHIYAVVTFAKDENETALINQRIHDIIIQNPGTNVIFIDCSKNTLGIGKFNEWVEHKATSHYFAGKDNSQSQQYTTYASGILRDWKERIRNGQYVVYTADIPSGDSKASMESLAESLMDEDKKRFPLGLENFKVSDPLWTATTLGLGAQCGVNQKVSGLYSNAKKLETSLSGAWEVVNYWQVSPSLHISRIKTAVNEMIEKAMETEGRISIREIFESLKDAPYGFMPCNLSAFVLGFVLKEYVNDGKYTWSDGLTSDELTIDKFKEMVGEVIKLDNTPNPRYRDKYIVTMTPEERSFIDGTSDAFGIPKNQCASLEQARERIRARMKDLSFPIWTIIHILNKEQLESSQEDIQELLNLYIGLANNNKAETGKSESDLAMEIGKIFLDEPKTIADLKRLLTNDKCIQGMKAYLSTFQNGLLPQLAAEAHDDGQYVNAVRKKIDADAANWVWKQKMVDEKIDETIRDYQIVIETSKLFSVTCKTIESAMSEWNNKCGNIRLSYHAIKTEVGDLDMLLTKLYSLRKNGYVQDMQMADFLNNISCYGEQFKEFYANQLALFCKVEDFYLSDLSEADKSTIFSKVSKGSFVKDKADYANEVEHIVNEYKKELGSQRLKAFWKEKTGTDSPYAWSQKYRMPILAMVGIDQYADYKKAFGAVNSKMPDSNSVQSAQIFLESCEIWDGLKDEKKREAAFIKRIIGDRAVILKDTASIKEYLSAHITAAPYSWLEDPMVGKSLDQLAQSAYNSGGYHEAFAKIDDMPADKVKQYLKEMIKNNMTVGIEIIKDK